MSNKLCKGGCGQPAVFKGWCSIKWQSGKKYTVNCPIVEQKRGLSISRYRIIESNLGKNPMQNPAVCAKNHSKARAEKISALLKERGKQGILPQQIENPELKEKRRKNVSKAMQRLLSEGKHPRQTETLEQRENRTRKSLSTLLAKWEREKIQFTSRSKYVGHKELILKSQWEKAVAEFLDANNIYWEYESIALPYYDSENEMFRITIPDFYIPSKNLIIEVKGYGQDWQSTHDKLTWIKEFDYDVILVGRSCMKELLAGKINNLKQLQEVAA